MRRPLTLTYLWLLSTVAMAQDADWPSLAELPHISGRPATEKDIDAGRATFLLGSEGTSKGNPMTIQIPQYAWHAQEGDPKVPVIIIQAESLDGMDVLGVYEFQSGQYGVGLIQEFTLLGDMLE